MTTARDRFEEATFNIDWSDRMAEECAKALAEQSDAEFFHPRSSGRFAAKKYLAAHANDKPPAPRKFIVAALVILAGLVFVCAFSWQSIAAALGFAGLSSMAGSGLIAEAGRSWGVVR
jgi:uncharacterized membrane protein YccC